MTPTKLTIFIVDDNCYAHCSYSAMSELTLYTGQPAVSRVRPLQGSPSRSQHMQWPKTAVPSVLTTATQLPYYLGSLLSHTQHRPSLPYREMGRRKP
jgi:hypothetical protein